MSSIALFFIAWESEPIMRIYNSIFLFLDCTRAALYYSQFKIVVIYLILLLGANPVYPILSL